MINKFAVISLVSLILAVSSCMKNEESCQPKTVASELAQMQALATSQGMNAPLTHSSGLLYQITVPGSGPTPELTSKVFIRYTGKFEDGRVFDSQTNHLLTGWTLNTLIPGWQLALPMLQEGGTMKIVIPSSLAYGCNSVGPIPGNSVLYFEVQLVDVQ